VKRLLLVALVSCGLDEAGTGASADAGKDVALKDVTVLDVATNDATSDVIADVASDVVTTCNPTAPFGNLTSLAGVVNTGAYESTPMLTPDELGIFFARDTGGGKIGLFYATRGATNQPFGNANQLSISGNGSIDTSPWVDDKMMLMLFASERNGDKHYHLYQATGDGTPDGWSNVTELTTLNWSEPAADVNPWMVPSTGEVWFASDRMGSLDIFYALNTATPPAYYAALDTGQAESHPVLTADALTIFFERTDLQNKGHIFVATRASTFSVFGNVSQLTEFDQQGTQSAPGWLSADGCRMYFSTDRSGNFDIWMATRGS
jgi:Tol biopolymer transport system component